MLPDQRRRLKQVVLENIGCTSLDLKDIRPIGEIKLERRPDSQGAIYTGQYPLSPAQRAGFLKVTQELLQAGLISEESSPHNSPVYMVPKKDGKWRFTLDYRRLNQHLIRDTFPIPNIEDLFNEMRGCRY